MGVAGRTDNQDVKLQLPALPREDTEDSTISMADSEVLLLSNTKQRSSGLIMAWDSTDWSLFNKQGLLMRVAFALVVAAGLTCLVFLARAATQSGSNRRGERTKHRPPLGGDGNAPPNAACLSFCPLRTLFVDPEMHDVATANILKVGETFLSTEDVEMVTHTVAKVFSNVSSLLGTYAPPVASELDQIEMTVSEKEAILAHLHLLADERVRSFGLDVGLAIRESPSPDQEYLGKRINEKLAPRLSEIRELSDAVVPPTLVALWGNGRTWSMTLEAKNVRSMESVSSTFVDSFHPTKPASSEVKELAVRGGALEMAKSLLDVALLCVHTIGTDWSMDIGDTLEMAGDAPLAWPCEVDAEGDTQIDFDKGLICPLKFGAQGLDAMRAVSES